MVEDPELQQQGWRGNKIGHDNDKAKEIWEEDGGG
jgi:hypothetical protein